MSEQCERTDERVALCLHLDSCLLANAVPGARRHFPPNMAPSSTHSHRAACCCCYCCCCHQVCDSKRRWKRLQRSSRRRRKRRRKKRRNQEDEEEKKAEGRKEKRERRRGKKRGSTDWIRRDIERSDLRRMGWADKFTPTWFSKPSTIWALILCSAFVRFLSTRVNGHPPVRIFHPPLPSVQRVESVVIPPVICSNQ